MRRLAVEWGWRRLRAWGGRIPQFGISEKSKIFQIVQNPLFYNDL
jgi:hypothetical protein